MAGLKLSGEAELLKRGRVPVDLKILESSDGAAVQLIYLGPRDTRIELVGIIEGQGAPRNLSPKDTSQEESPVARYKSYRSTQTVGLFVSGGTALYTLALMISMLRDVRRARPERQRATQIMAAAFSVVFVVAVLWFGYMLWDWWSNPVPPFAF